MYVVQNGIKLNSIKLHIILEIISIIINKTVAKLVLFIILVWRY